jgi:hypothetical protein
MKEKIISEEEEKVLKRYTSPSFIDILNINGVKSMIIITSLLFFKFRIINDFNV